MTVERRSAIATTAGGVPPGGVRARRRTLALAVAGLVLTVCAVGAMREWSRCVAREHDRLSRDRHEEALRSLRALMDERVVEGTDGDVRGRPAGPTRPAATTGGRTAAADAPR
jgi:hypothetical protein